MAEQTTTAIDRSSLRMHMFVPAIILFLAGLSVTFTQDLHEVLSFNAWVIALFGVLFGASVFAAPAFGGVRTSSSMVVATVSVLAGVAAPFMPSVAALGLVLIVWASAVTIATVWHWVSTRERETLTIGIAAAALAAILVFGARELPAVMGFFAAYCIIIGVYLGIAAFDRTHQASDSEASFA